MAAFPRQVLYVWTGDVEAAAEAAELLRWYAGRTCLMGVAGMSYLLQHAMGESAPSHQGQPRVPARC